MFSAVLTVCLCVTKSNSASKGNNSNNANVAGLSVLRAQVIMIFMGFPPFLKRFMH